jgi:hypothetical protein
MKAEIRHLLPIHWPNVNAQDGGFHGLGKESFIIPLRDFNSRRSVFGLLGCDGRAVWQKLPKNITPISLLFFCFNITVL